MSHGMEPGPFLFCKHGFVLFESILVMINDICFKFYLSYHQLLCANCDVNFPSSLCLREPIHLINGKLETLKFCQPHYGRWKPDLSRTSCISTSVSRSSNLTSLQWRSSTSAIAQWFLKNPSTYT